MSLANFFAQGGYRPSGKCDWFKLGTVALPLSLLSACILAFIMAKVFIWGFYFFVIVPIFAGALLGLSATRLLRFSQCRSPVVAGVFGLLVATFMYLGYFHAYFVCVRGPRVLPRIDMIPAVINFRLHTDVIHDSHEFGQNGKKEPSLVMNCLFLAGDWLFAAGACAAIAYAGARQAYCETCSRWMQRKKAAVAPGNAENVVRHIKSKQIAALPDIPAASAKGARTQFELEYCPGNNDQVEVCPIFLTATEIVPGNNKSTTVARQIPLTVEELAELSKKVAFQ
jgi:hypothetical protein